MLPRKSWRNPRVSPSTQFQMEIFPGDYVRNESGRWFLPSVAVERDP